MGRLLGRGAYGEVKLGVHKSTGNQRAIKQMDKPFMDERTKKKMEDEIKSLSTLDHPNILKMHEYFEDDNKYYIVTDIYKGGELFDEI